MASVGYELTTRRLTQLFQKYVAKLAFDLVLIESTAKKLQTIEPIDWTFYRAISPKERLTELDSFRRLISEIQTISEMYKLRGSALTSSASSYATNDTTDKHFFFKTSLAKTTNRNEILVSFFSNFEEMFDEDQIANDTIKSKTERMRMIDDFVQKLVGQIIAQKSVVLSANIQTALRLVRSLQDLAKLISKYQIQISALIEGLPLVFPLDLIFLVAHVKERCSLELSDFPNFLQTIKNFPTFSAFQSLAQKLLSKRGQSEVLNVVIPSLQMRFVSGRRFDPIPLEDTNYRQLQQQQQQKTLEEQSFAANFLEILNSTNITREMMDNIAAIWILTPDSRGKKMFVIDGDTDIDDLIDRAKQLLKSASSEKFAIETFAINQQTSLQVPPSQPVTINQTNIAILQQQINDLQIKQAELQQQLAKSQNEESKLKTEKTFLEGRVKNLNDVLNSTQMNLNSSGSTQAAEAQLLSEKIQLLDEKANLTQALNNAQANIQSLSDRIISLSNDLQNKTDEKTTAESNLAEAKKNIKDAQDQIIQLRDEKQTLEQKNELSKEAFANLVKSQQKQLGDANIAISENNQLRTTLKERESKIFQLQDEVNLKTQAINNITGEKNQLQFQVNQANQQVQLLQIQNTTISSKLSVSLVELVEIHEPETSFSPDQNVFTFLDGNGFVSRPFKNFEAIVFGNNGLVGEAAFVKTLDQYDSFDLSQQLSTTIRIPKLEELLHTPQFDKNGNPLSTTFSLFGSKHKQTDLTIREEGLPQEGFQLATRQFLKNLNDIDIGISGFNFRQLLFAYINATALFVCYIRNLQNEKNNAQRKEHKKRFCGTLERFFEKASLFRYHIASRLQNVSDFKISIGRLLGTFFTVSDAVSLKKILNDKTLDWYTSLLNISNEKTKLVFRNMIELLGNIALTCTSNSHESNGWLDSANLTLVSTNAQKDPFENYWQGFINRNFEIYRGRPNNQVFSSFSKNKHIASISIGDEDDDDESQNDDTSMTETFELIHLGDFESNTQAPGVIAKTNSQDSRMSPFTMIGDSSTTSTNNNNRSSSKPKPQVQQKRTTPLSLEMPTSGTIQSNPALEWLYKFKDVVDSVHKRAQSMKVPIVRLTASESDNMIQWMGFGNNFFTNQRANPSVTKSEKQAIIDFIDALKTDQSFERNLNWELTFSLFVDNANTWALRNSVVHAV